MLPLPALLLAYVGPNSGAGGIAGLIGVIAAVLLAIVGFLFYPLKRLFSKNKRGIDGSAANETE